MKFVIERKNLLDLIKLVLPVVGTAKQLPVFNAIKIEADNNQVFLTGCDLTTSLKSHGEAVVQTPGATCVAGKALYEVVSQLPESKLEVTLGDMLQIKNPISAIHLTTMDAENYPITPNYSNFTFRTWPNFFEVVKKVSFAASADESRPHLGSVCLASGHAVATDAHRLAMVTHEVELEGQALIPANELNIISRIFTNPEVSVSFDGTSLHIMQPGVACTIRRIDSKYPDYERVIPQSPFHLARVKRDDLAKAISVTKIVADEMITTRFEFAQGRLTLQASSSELGNANYSIECDYDSPEVVVGLNGSYIQQALQKMTSDVIDIEVRSSNEPVLLKERGYLHVVMPLRLR